MYHSNHIADVIDVATITNTSFSSLAPFIQTQLNILSTWRSRFLPLSTGTLLFVLPILLSFIHALWSLIKFLIGAVWTHYRGVVVRDIISVTAAMRYLNGLPNDRNLVLQNAVFMYLSQVVWSKRPIPPQAWCNKSSVLLLVDPFKSHVYEDRTSPFYLTSSSEEDNDISDATIQRSSKHLERLMLVKLPVGGDWIHTQDELGVEISYDRRKVTVSDEKAVERIVSLRASGPDAAARLHLFAQRCLHYYTSRLPNLQNSTRNYYELQPSKRDGWVGDMEDDHFAKPLFKRYTLSDDKNFNSLFFSEKEKTLKLVDDFMFRSGRFAVEGFPHKLGFLLYGPPGTGKTSFVKALATYTGRHIVSVPLTLVKTNQQLYDIFLNRIYRCIGESEVQAVKLEEVIFLLDDVNATGPLVCARTRQRTVRRRKPAVLTAHVKQPPLPGDAEGMEEYVVHLEEKESCRDNTAFMNWMSRAAAAPNTFGASELNTLLRVAVAGGKEGAVVKKKPSEWSADGDGADAKLSFFKMFEAADKLDLSGLLNVLDGVIDMPSRIVVMITTNPEFLDPALVRPGRMSLRIRMDYIEFEGLASMLGLHFGEHAPPADVTVLDILDDIEAKLGKTRESAKGYSRPMQREQFSSDVAVTEGGALSEDFPLLSPNQVTLECSATADDSLKLNLESSAAAAANSFEKAYNVPIGVAAARMPHHTLSPTQLDQLRKLIAGLEAEAVACKETNAEGVPHSLSTSQKREQVDKMESEVAAPPQHQPHYNFYIKPCEIEMLCAVSNSFEESLDLLDKLIRGELHL